MNLAEQICFAKFFEYNCVEEKGKNYCPGCDGTECDYFTPSCFIIDSQHIIGRITCEKIPTKNIAYDTTPLNSFPLGFMVDLEKTLGL